MDRIVPTGFDRAEQKQHHPPLDLPKPKPMASGKVWARIGRSSNGAATVCSNLRRFRRKMQSSRSREGVKPLPERGAIIPITLHTNVLLLLLKKGHHLFRVCEPPSWIAGWRGPAQFMLYPMDIQGYIKL